MSGNGFSNDLANLLLGWLAIYALGVGALCVVSRVRRARAWKRCAR